MIKRATAVTALAGALIALVIVGGFLALDGTVLHWYVESDEPIPTPVPTRLAGPVFLASDVLNLTRAQVEEADVFPSDTRWVSCVRATYWSGNGVWVVECEFRVNRTDDPEVTRSYTFDDRTGNLLR